MAYWFAVDYEDKDFCEVLMMDNISTSLDNICKRIISTLINPPPFRDTSVVAISAINPVAGVAATGINSFWTNFNEYKVNRLLCGLSTDLNQEAQLNDLYNYVNSSSKRAFIVGNIFRETLNANSPKTCVLYGKILSDHIGEKESDFSREELIVCSALEDANDYDLDGFIILMKNCIRKRKDGSRTIDIENLDKDIANKKSDLITTCLWGANNRIFSQNVAAFDENHDGNISLENVFYVENAADILFKWINEVRQIWDYGS